MLYAPLGYAVRATRDSALRAEAVGLATQRLRLLAFGIAGAAAGLAGGLYAYAKGSVFPTYISIPKSVDALLMVLLGGVGTMAGPIVGALAYVGLYDVLLRATGLWRLVLGGMIVLLVVLFPAGIAGGRAAPVGPPRMSVLSVQGLCKSWGGVAAVQSVGFSVAAGEMLALIGPNGAGKSTCFNMVGGQLRPDAGTVALDGRPITGLSPRAVWQRRRGPHLPDHGDLREHDGAGERADGADLGRRARGRLVAAGARPVRRGGGCAAGPGGPPGRRPSAAPACWPMAT